MKKRSIEPHGELKAPILPAMGASAATVVGIVISSGICTSSIGHTTN